MIYFEKDVDNFASSLAAVSNAVAQARQNSSKEKEQTISLASQLGDSKWLDNIAAGDNTRPERRQLMEQVPRAIGGVNPDSQEFKALLTMKTQQKQQELQANELATRPDAMQVQESYARDKRFNKPIQQMLTEEKDPVKRKNLLDRYQRQHPQGAYNQIGTDITNAMSGRSSIKMNGQPMGIGEQPANFKKAAEEAALEELTQEQKQMFVKNLNSNIMQAKQTISSEERSDFDKEVRQAYKEFGLTPQLKTQLDRIFHKYRAGKAEIDSRLIRQAAGTGGGIKTKEVTILNPNTGKPAKAQILAGATPKQTAEFMLQTNNFGIKNLDGVYPIDKNGWPVWIDNNGESLDLLEAAEKYEQGALTVDAQREYLKAKEYKVKRSGKDALLIIANQHQLSDIKAVDEIDRIRTATEKTSMDIYPPKKSSSEQEADNLASFNQWYSIEKNVVIDGQKRTREELINQWNSSSPDRKIKFKKGTFVNK